MTPIIKDHWAKCPVCGKDNSNNVIWGPMDYHKEFKCCGFGWTIQMVEAIDSGYRKQILDVIPDGLMKTFSQIMDWFPDDKVVWPTLDGIKRTPDVMKKDFDNKTDTAKQYISDILYCLVDVYGRTAAKERTGEDDRDPS